MTTDHEPKYYADYLGVVPQTHKDIFTDCLRQDGLDIFRQHLAHLLNRPVPNNYLHELDDTITRQIGGDRFTTLFASPKQLPDKMKERWGLVSGAATETLVPFYLASTGQLEDRDVFISGEKFAKAMIGILRDREVYEDVKGFLMTQEGSDQPNLKYEPDALKVRVDENTATLSEVLEIKSSTVDYGRARNQTRTTLFENPKTRKLLQELISCFAHIPPDQITIPFDVRVILVAGEKGHAVDKPNDLDRHFGESVIMDIATRNRGYFILKAAIGAIPHEEDPENYFVPISNQVAHTIRYIRGANRYALAA